MRQPGPRRSVAVLVILGAAAATPGAESTQASSTGEARASAAVVHVRFRSPARAEVARQAVAGAVRRLASDECRAVLTDFRDASGVRLAARLAAAGTSMEEWVRGVYFYDGNGRGSCHKRGVMAVTSAGSRVVFLCPAFTFEQRRDPGLAEALVIHELLHTLGLAENPPTSLEINRRVFERCGR